VSAVLDVDDVVLVVAEELANGAPHPYTGRVGVVVDVRAIGRYRVRVAIDGRQLMFAADELERHPSAVSHDETAVRDVR
jgi:ribosomal protein L21E